MTPHQLWFRSTLFEIEPGEDEETNPYCYGRQLSRWLRERLAADGLSIEEVIPEDWGWCLVVQRKPYLLWVGCGCVQDFDMEQPSDAVPLGRDVVWTCMVVAEQSLFGKLLGGRNTTQSVDALFLQVKRVIESDASNTLVSEP